MPKRGLTARATSRVINLITPPPPPPPAPPAPPPPAPPALTAEELLVARLRAARPELASVTVGKQVYWAQPLTEVDSYAEVVQRNLDLVTSVTVAADVRAALVDQNEPGRTVVAIRSEDRDVVLKHLIEVLGNEAVYLAPMPPNRRLSTTEQPKIKSTPVLAGLITPDDWPGAEAASVLRVFRAWTGPQGRRVIAGNAACEIEWWENDRAGLRRPPRGNRMVSELRDWPPAAEPSPPTTIPPLVPTAKRLDNDVPFPIDLVYTWVDGSDPRLQAERSRYGESVPDAHRSALAAARWRNRDELRYSLRSMQSFASWIRHIWIVTADQVPDWLDPAVPGLTVVSHREIFTDPSVLPTFNSHAIESQLHHIDGLAEHYLYANDDVFLGRPMRPDHFFLGNGLARVFRSSSKIDLGPGQPEDRPLLAAHKKLRTMLERDFGVTISHRLKHTVFPQTRSVLAELEERYQDEFTGTAASRFRSAGDLSVASALVPNYLYLTGRAYAAPLSYGYVASGQIELAEVLQSWLVNGTLESMCINDEGMTDDEVSEVDQHRLITEFLAEYYPWPSRFERSTRSESGSETA
jgi:hypothetical protein